MNPFQLKDRVIAALKVFFCEDDEYTYNDDPELSKIIIGDVYGIDRKIVEKFPIITVGRGDMAAKREWIGSRQGISWASTEGQQPTETFANMIAGNMICSCISTVGIESERIAMKVANFLEMTRHELRPVLRLYKMEGVVIGSENRLKEWPGQIDTPVRFNYIYPTRWKVTDTSVLMKRLNCKINPV